MIPVTDWFPGSVRPHRPGHYDREFLDSNGNWCDQSRERWTGTAWVTCNRYVSIYQSNEFGTCFRWRGLSEDPQL